MEKEGLPEKLSPMKKLNKIEEKGTSEIKPTEGEESRKIIAPNQMNESLTTIEGLQITKADRMSLENGKNVTCTIISLFIKKLKSNNKDPLEKKQNIVDRTINCTITTITRKDICQRTKRTSIYMTKYD